MNSRVAIVRYKSPYKLVLAFTNNEVKEFDFSGYLNYSVYEALRDEAFCAKAKVVGGTVAWDDFVDFDPDTLYLDSKPLVVV